MIVTKDNERLYLTTWSYNAARVISRLAELVKEKGGRVAPTHPALITNRTLTGSIAEKEDHLRRCQVAQDANWTEIREKHIKAVQAELDERRSIRNDPIRVSHTSYISFVLGDNRYYYQVDDNPFFDFFGSKSPVVNGMYDPHAVCRTDNKRNWTDDIFTYGFSEKDVDRTANGVLQFLLNLPSVKPHKKDLRKIDF